MLLDVGSACAIKGITEGRYLSVDLQLTPACSLSIYSEVCWFVYDAAGGLQTRTITFHLHQEEKEKPNSTVITYFHLSL